MTVSLIRILAAAAVCSLVVTGSRRSAEPVAPAADTKPLKLKTFMRKPVAIVGDPHREEEERRIRQGRGQAPRQKDPRRRRAATPAPRYISPAAAQAFAAYELARVRVVTPEEAEGARLFADDAINDDHGGRRRQRADRQRR